MTSTPSSTTGSTHQAPATAYAETMSAHHRSSLAPAATTAGTTSTAHSPLTRTASPIIIVHPAEPTAEESQSGSKSEKMQVIAMMQQTNAKFHEFLSSHAPVASCVTVADDWTPQVRSGSFSYSITTPLHDRSTSVGNRGGGNFPHQPPLPHQAPTVFSSYPHHRASIDGQKQVAFLAIQPADVHEVQVQNPAGNRRLDSESRKKEKLSNSCIYERHPRLINSIYRSDLTLKYELLVPPKKATRNFIEILSRIFARTAGVITHGSRNDAQRLTHLPEVVVVQNENAGTRQPSPCERSVQPFSRSSSLHNVATAEQPRSRVSTNASHGSHEHRDTTASQSSKKTTTHHEDVEMPSGGERFGGRMMSLQPDGASNGRSSRRPTMDSGGNVTIRPGSLSSQGVGFVLQKMPPAPPRSPPNASVDRPDSPHIATPTRTGDSMSSFELDASTPDRYRENASALYLLQPVSVNTFRRLRPTEAMSIRYIDRTSSLSLCVSGSSRTSDSDDQRTQNEEVDGSGRSGGGESGSVMSRSEFGDYGTSLIPHHKRALVYQGGEWLINNPDRTVYTLLYTKHTKVGMKDFAVDFRAQMDTDRLLRDCIVFLDSHDSHIYRIMQRLVSAIVDKDFEASRRINESMRKARCKDEAIKRLFVDKSVTVLSRCIQGGCLSEMLDDTLDIQMACDQVWICAFAALHDICGRHVAFCRVNSPVNMGHISEELKFVVLVMTPMVEKSTKTALETARTFATLFLDIETRNQLSGALDEQEFRDILTDHANRLHAIQEHPELVRRLTQKRASRVYFKSRCLSWYPGQGIYLDVKRRWPHYKSDYTDGIRGPNTVHKLLSTIVFLYFAVLLPTLAFGVLNDSNTAGKIGVQKHIFAQVFGGLAFGIFGGQPLLVLMTTAPLGLYMRILYSIANQFKVDFFAFYSCIGLWNCFFLCIYALMNTSCLTNLCTRTIQDIFEMFALFAFVVDGLTELMHNFGEHYFSEACSKQAGGTGGRSGVWALTGSDASSAPSSATALPPSTTTTQLSSSSSSSTSSITTESTTLSPFFEAWNYLMGSTISSNSHAAAGATVFHKRAAEFVEQAVGSGLADYGSGYLHNSSPMLLSDTFHTFDPNATTTTAMMTTTTERVASTLTKLLGDLLNDPNITAIGGIVSAADPNATSASDMPPHSECRRDRALLYLLLMLATWWSSLRLHGFAKTPYLNKKIREFLADYSLPIAIIAVSLIGRLVFGDVQLEQFTIYDYRPSRAPIENLPLWCIFVCGGIGFIISLLFFFDTTITNSVVCRPTNKLKKGTTYDYDLLIVALINGVLSLFALPWLYPTTPQSPLHLLGLADVEERVDAGHVYQAVRAVRETRLTTIVASVMIGLSLFMLPYPLAYISRPVLNGLFLYMAAMSIHDNQLMERIMLLFTEQNAYPPHHYIRTVPQRQLHLITVIQIFQLIVICGMGLYGRNIYVEMMFPIVLCLMFPVRHSLMPKFIDIKYLESLEGQKCSQLAKRAPFSNAAMDM